jgi:AcrR family transcriptional regulator
MAQGAERLTGKAATQNRILRAAGSLFVEHGFEHTTIADVAEGAGVSRATVFWHFGDKAGLFRETFADLLVPFRDSIGRDLSDLPPEKQLEQRAVSYLDFVHEHRATILGLVRWAIESPGLRTTLLETLLDLHRRYVAVLSEALDEMLPSEHDPRAVAAGLMAALDGNLLLALFDGSETAAESRRTSTAAILALIPRK